MRGIGRLALQFVAFGATEKMLVIGDDRIPLYSFHEGLPGVLLECLRSSFKISNQGTQGIRSAARDCLASPESRLVLDLRVGACRIDFNVVHRIARPTTTG